MEARYLTDLEWRICHAVNIYVFRNGRDGEQPILVHIPPAKKKNMRTVMGVIQERVKYPVGYAKFLYKMDGTRVKDPCELEMYNNYVVASNFDKYFKCAAYGRKRSPLLVLNRESKHVRVLKLQNQNYYEWLLKKKAVGEERPPYIYPAYYTNENLRPQDLPLGNMGNYQPPEVQAPGCCYPRADGGKTYRVEGDQQYVVNSVTVDVNPDLTGLTDVRKMRRSNKKYSEGNIKNKHQERRSKKAMKERTPSDMVNANVFTSTGTSQETVGTSETDELLKSNHKSHHHHQSMRSNNNTKQHQLQRGSRSHSRRKSKHSHRTQAHAVVSEEFREKQQPQVVEVHESSCQSSEDLRKLQKKASRKSKKRERERDRDIGAAGTDLIPPAPPQFRDPVDARNNFIMKPGHVDANNNNNNINNQEIFKLVERAFHTPGVSLTPSSVNPQKPFLYSPEKLAEINSAGSIQPLELTFANQQQTQSSNPAPIPGQWALIRQPPPPPQIMQQVFALDTHTGQNISRAINTQTSLDSARQSGLLPPYPSNQQQSQNHHLVQQQPPPPPPGMPQFHTLIPAQTISSSPSSSQSPASFHQSHQSIGPMQTQCLMIPANMSQQPLQQPGNVSLPQHTTHLVALPNANSQNQLQQVYQLGIVQQPNPQNCIEVDARAMRQFVDNQKLIEERFKHASYQIHNSKNRVDRGDQTVRARRSDSTIRATTSDQTESELDIPFTPLKTYRLHPRSSASPPALTDRRRHKHGHGDDGMNHTSRSRFRLERLPKVKSRNVAIQMGFPTASARTARRFSHFLDSLHKVDPQSEISIILDRNRNHSLNHGSSSHAGRKYSSSMCMLEPPVGGSMFTPRSERERDRDRFPMANASSRDFWNMRRSTNFGSSYSEQYVNLNSGRFNNVDKFNDSKLLRTARNRLSDPVLEELVTIPPPTEFRETQRFPGRPRPPPRQDSPNNNNTFNDKPPHSPSNHKYAYTNNDRAPLKYMYDQYP